MATARKTRSSALSASLKGKPIDTETPVTGRTKTLLKTKPDLPSHAGRTKLLEAKKEIPTLHSYSDIASSQAPLQTPQAVYDFDDTEKSEIKPPTSAATHKPTRKRNQNAGPSFKTKRSCVSKKLKVSPAQKPTTRVKEISPILPDQTRVTTAPLRSRREAKRAPQSPPQGAPSRKQTVTSIQAWEEGQENFVNPLLSSSSDSLESPPIIPVKTRKQQAKTKTSTPASAADGGRNQPCPSMEPLNLTDSSLSDEMPNSVDVIDTESGLFTDYSSAYTVSHMSEEEEKPPRQGSKRVHDEPDMISNKENIVAYKAKKIKRPKGRYSESKIDAWAEEKKKEFDEIEKFELSIDD